MENHISTLPLENIEDNYRVNSSSFFVLAAGAWHTGFRSDTGAMKSSIIESFVFWIQPAVNQSIWTGRNKHSKNIFHNFLSLVSSLMVYYAK
jgi:hypothetical protein